MHSCVHLQLWKENNRRQMVSQNLDWPNHSWGPYVILLSKTKQTPLSDPGAICQRLTKSTLYTIWPKAFSGPIW